MVEKKVRVWDLPVRLFHWTLVVLLATSYFSGRAGGDWMLATLFVSRGTPMLTAGDEMRRTQSGNNNAYCQDNEVSWFDWENADGELLEFTRRLAELRRRHPAFRRRGWFQGRPIRHGAGAALPDIAWFTPDGIEMTDEHWESDVARSLQVFLDGHGIAVPDERGEPIVDDTFLIVFHAGPRHSPLGSKRETCRFPMNGVPC